MEINLLPKKYKQRAKVFYYIDVSIPYLVAGAIGVLAVNLVLGSLVTKVNFNKSRIESNWQRKKPQYEEIISIKAELSKLQQQTRDLQEVTKAKLFFSEFLYLVYSNLPGNIWFSSLNYKEGILRIKGAALDYKEEAPMSLNRYLNDLKSTDIKKQFPVIAVESQQMSRLKANQVLFFDLVFKENE
jgi:Tfp pilus assembly protein PilN